MLTCPACDTPLEERDAGACLVDCCPGCRGMWLDHGELQKLTAGCPQALAALDAAGDAADQPATAGTGDAASRAALRRLRHCPSCQRGALGKVPMPRSRLTEIERCFYCGGVWLDAGELRAAAEKPAASPPPESRTLPTSPRTTALLPPGYQGVPTPPLPSYAHSRSEPLFSGEVGWFLGELLIEGVVSSVFDW